jgi:hypothetical protein
LLLRYLKLSLSKVYIPNTVILWIKTHQTVFPEEADPGVEHFLFLPPAPPAVEIDADLFRRWGTTTTDSPGALSWDS